MELLLENVTRFVELTPEEQKILMDSFTIEKYAAKEILMKENNICTHQYFVLRGILRLYYLDENFNEHTLSFAPADWWMGDMYSFISQEPGNSIIEVVEDAIVMVQTREQQLEIFERVPKMERYFRILIERSLVANQQRLLDKMRLSAEERYEKFIKRYPDVTYNVPQKQIASYLGITPEFFSKMKARMLRRGRD